MDDPIEKQARIRVAAVGDVHCTRTSTGRLSPMFAEIARTCDVVVLCGDLTDYGLPEEAHILATELQAAAGLPILAVLGNHDYESGKQDDVERVLTEAGVSMLDGDAFEVHGVSFVGTKGFGGGFGDRALQPWGEDGIKAFVREALNESLKLESALAKARSTSRVVVLHYAPIAETVQGEPLEIFPFLGSSRLAEPIDRYHTTFVVHGHAHRGSPEGRTPGGVSVYNVAMPLLRKHFPDRSPFRIIEIPVQSLHENLAVPS